MKKEINIGAGTENVEINQTIAPSEPSGPSVGGVDVGIILIIVAVLYVAKKMVDKWIR